MCWIRCAGCHTLSCEGRCWLDERHVVHAGCHGTSGRVLASPNPVGSPAPSLTSAATAAQHRCWRCPSILLLPLPLNRAGMSRSARPLASSWPRPRPLEARPSTRSQRRTGEQQNSCLSGCCVAPGLPVLCDSHAARHQWCADAGCAATNAHLFCRISCPCCRAQAYDVPQQLEGLPEMKPEDQQYFGKLLKVSPLSGFYRFCWRSDSRVVCASEPAQGRPEFTCLLSVPQLLLVSWLRLRAGGPPAVVHV